MLYRVKANIDKMKMKAFFNVLTDGTVADQEPDGAEIINAMQKAVMTSADTLEWYETCLCATPLKHERETVYDKFLHITDAVPAEEEKKIKGNLFWTCLEERYFEDDILEGLDNFDDLDEIYVDNY